jgi:glycosyltransferase involved in cell wall biosynthesis
VKTVSLVIPAVPKRIANGMLREAIASVLAQQGADAELKIILGVDETIAKPEHVDEIVLGTCQSTKVNAGAAIAEGDYLAFLHDDDLWRPDFLREALAALEEAEFCSASQLEVDGEGAVIQTSDFACPSGWLMRREVWARVEGGFDASYKHHPDTDWLGRFGEVGQSRAHLLERTAPHKFIDKSATFRPPHYNPMSNRPNLRNLLINGRPEPKLIYTNHAEPLILRRQFPDAIMRRAEDDPTRMAESQWEYGRMVNRYNRVPW